MRTIYLTFDDGPEESVTPDILDILHENKIKATFFLIGNNIRKDFSIVRRMVNEGHSIGNHSTKHTDLTTLNNEDFFDDVEETSNTISNFTSKKLFRPPWGKINSEQTDILKHNNFKIIFWDLASMDHDKNFKILDVVKHVLENIGEGGVLLFHDLKKTKYALPIIIEELKNRDYKFSKID